jgi:hypothetical protein
MGTGEFMQIGDAARLLAFHLGERFASAAQTHMGTARDRLLDAAKGGRFPIVAGTGSWSVAASYSLPGECVQGLEVENIDWENSVFDASADVPMEATAAIQHLHSSPAVLWVPVEEFAGSFGIQPETIGRWNRR